MNCSKCHNTGLIPSPDWENTKVLCDCAAAVPMQVFWVVGYRWIIHWGEPTKIVVLRGFQNREKDRTVFDAAFVFERYPEACNVADSYQQRKDALTINFS